MTSKIRLKMETATSAPITCGDNCEPELRSPGCTFMIIGRFVGAKIGCVNVLDNKQSLLEDIWMDERIKFPPVPATPMLIIVKLCGMAGLMKEMEARTSSAPSSLSGRSVLLKITESSG